MTTHLFVYGTLRADGGHGHLLGGRRRVAATTTGALWHLPAGYPALDVHGTGTVHGELVSGVDDALLDLLDHYEGVAEGLFRRTLHPVRAGRTRVDAWMYAMDHPDRRGGRPVPDGRWTRGLRR